MYVFTQDVLGKNELYNFTVIKDESGKTFFSYFDVGVIETDEISERSIAFDTIVEDSGAEHFYLMTPDKEIKGTTEFETGLPYAYNNEAADSFLASISEAGVDYMDLRENLVDSDLDMNEVFYDTDHHWTTETAFWAFTELVDYLNTSYGEDLDPDYFYRDIDNYNQIVYEDSFLGSQGRQAGIEYAGIDDFTLIYPKFATDFTYYSYNAGYEETYTGRFEKALIQANTFNNVLDVMETENDKYFSYLVGNKAEVYITNEEIESGVKILIIKDSFVVPMAAFLSTVCDEVVLIDPRYYDGDIAEFAASGDYDYVIESFSPANLTTEFFTYCVD